MESLEPTLPYIERNGEIFINAKAIESILLTQADEIRSRYTKTPSEGLPSQAVLGVITGIRLSSELISRAIIASEIDGMLTSGSSPESQ